MRFLAPCISPYLGLTGNHYVPSSPSLVPSSLISLSTDSFFPYYQSNVHPSLSRPLCWRLAVDPSSPVGLTRRGTGVKLGPSSRSPAAQFPLAGPAQLGEGGALMVPVPNLTRCPISISISISIPTITCSTSACSRLESSLNSTIPSLRLHKVRSTCTRVGRRVAKGQGHPFVHHTVPLSPTLPPP